MSLYPAHPGGACEGVVPAAVVPFVRVGSSGGPDALPDADALFGPTEPVDALLADGAITDAAAEPGSVSLLVDAGSDALVVLHGAISADMHPEVRELVEDLIANTLATTGRAVRVLAEHVTAFELPGIWLLLELRRAAKPAVVTLVAPSTPVRDAIARHGIKGFTVEP